MTVLAFIRPDNWSWLLLGHLFGVAALFGSLLLVTAVSAVGRRVPASDALLVRRFTLLTIAFLAWPGFLVTIGLGHALQSKENIKATWIDVAVPLTEIVGFIGLGVLTYFANVAVRRARTGTDAPTALKVTAIIAPALLVVFAGVLFLMAGKP
jgi:hypothetical protein